MNKTAWKLNILWVLCLGIIVSGVGVIHAQPAPFVVGEALTYKLYAGGFLAGEQTMRIMERTTYNGRSALKITVTVDTAGLGSMFKYKESSIMMLDEKGGFPLFVRRDIEEKDGPYWIEITYNPATKQLVKRSTKTGQEVSDTYSADNGCMEDLSLYYYLRTRPWLKGDRDFLFLTKHGAQNFALDVKDGEELSTPIGKFKTDKLENEDSGYTLWFSKDDRALPLMIKKGNKTCKLVQVTNK